MFEAKAGSLQRVKILNQLKFPNYLVQLKSIHSN